MGKALLETREKDIWAEYLGSKEIFCQQQNLLLDRTAFGKLCSCNVYLELPMKLPISAFQKQIFMSCFFFVGVVTDNCFNSFIFSFGRKKSKDEQKGAQRNKVRV